MSIEQIYSIYLQYPLILTDTRKIEKGGIFFALKGENFDGNKYAAAALAAGAEYAVVDDAETAINEKYILTTDVLNTLQELARYHRQQLSIPIIAITGSNGKTTTKELTSAVLRQRYVTYATIGNLNNHIGIPLTLLKIKPDAEIAIVEMGANHQKEIESYCVVALPTHGVITNCGKAHIEGFGGEEGVRKGKGELYAYLRSNGGTIFRNNDLDYLKEMAAGIKDQITYGSNEGTYTGHQSTNGVFLTVAFTNNDTETIVNTNLVGNYNFANVMTAIAIGLHFSIPPEAIKAAIESYQPDNSRSQWTAKGSNKVILDAYNANPSSMRAAILNFEAATLPNKILWIGGMKEMGQDEVKEHQELVSLIASFNWDSVILVGSEFSGIQHPFRWFADSLSAAAYIAQQRPENSTILIKGSRGTKMEILLDAIS